VSSWVTVSKATRSATVSRSRPRFRLGQQKVLDDAERHPHTAQGVAVSTLWGDCCGWTAAGTSTTDTLNRFATLAPGKALLAAGRVWLNRVGDGAVATRTPLGMACLVAAGWWHRASYRPVRWSLRVNPGAASRNGQYEQG
jgi:hypothetical protein